MNRFIAFLVILLLGIVALGFYRDWFHVTVHQDKIDADKEKAQQKIESVKEEVKEKVENLKATTPEKPESTRVASTDQERAEYERKVAAELSVFDAKVGDLRSRAEKTEDKARIDDLGPKKKLAEGKFETLKSATAANWEDAKRQMDSALADLRKAYEEAKAPLK